MNRRWSAVLSSLIAVAAVIGGASIVGGEARAGSSAEYVAPATLECVDPLVVSTTGPTDAESMGGLRFGYGQDMVLTHTMAVDLPAGTYEVEASTHDSYSFRADVAPQANEQVRIVAVGGGDELAATGFTSDLADGSFTGWAVDELGTITLASAADAITIEHYAVDHATVGPDSLKVAALCFRPVESGDDGEEAADDETADDSETPCPVGDDEANDAAGDTADEAPDDSADTDGEDVAAEECEEPASGDDAADPCVGTDGAGDADDAAEGEDEVVEECEELSSGDDAADPCIGTTDEQGVDDGADDEGVADASCDEPEDEPTDEVPTEEEPAEEEPADEICVVVDDGDDTDFSDVADCEEVIIVEPCTDASSDGDDAGDAEADDGDVEHCDEAAEDDSDPEDGSEAGGSEEDGDETPEVDAGDESADDDSTDEASDDSTTDSTTDDSTSDDSTSDETQQPPAGPTTPPTTPTTTQDAGADDAGADDGNADDPEIPLVDTVPNTVPETNDDDPIQGAVNQQTPGQQGGLPITGAASGILVMLGLSLALAGFALIGMVGRQYLGSAD